MERHYQQGSDRNERHGGRERMRGLGGEWYGRDARGQSRHQHWAGDQDRDYSASGELWDEESGDYGRGEYGGGRDRSWASQGYRRGEGSDEGEFSRSQRYRSGGDHSSFRAGSRSGDFGEYGELAGGDTRSGAYRNYGSLRNSGRSTGSYGDTGYRAGEAGGWRGDGGLGRGYRGDYDSTRRSSQAFRHGGSQHGDYGSEGGRWQGFRGRGPRNYTRSDDRIREDLNEQLMDADDVDASDVSVEVKNAIVTLSGSVEHRWLKHRIEDMAGDCSGVKDVRNEIRVQSRSDWPYDKQQAGGGLDSTASSQGSSATSGGVSSSSRSQTGSSAH